MTCAPHYIVSLSKAPTYTLQKVSAAMHMIAASSQVSSANMQNLVAAWQQFIANRQQSSASMLQSSASMQQPSASMLQLAASLLPKFNIPKIHSLTFKKQKIMSGGDFIPAPMRAPNILSLKNRLPR